MLIKHKSQTGQTLIEVLIALTVGILILGALVIVTVTSIRNAQFSQNQTQATKLAQEGVDLVRTIRNRNLAVESSTPIITNFEGLWNNQFGDCLYQPKQTTCGPSATFTGYFILSPDEPKLTRVDTIAAASETINNIFTRFILIEDVSATSDTEKKLTVIVRWSDSSGKHESNVQTLITRQF